MYHLNFCWPTSMSALDQCDQIWRFIGLWPTFKCFWQHLICPNLSHSYGIFVKVSKSIIFLVKTVLGKFYKNLGIFFWSHCPQCTYLFKMCSKNTLKAPINSRQRTKILRDFVRNLWPIL